VVVVEQTPVCSNVGSGGGASSAIIFRCKKIMAESGLFGGKRRAEFLVS